MPRGQYVRSPEEIERIRALGLASRGSVATDATRLKMSVKRRGQPKSQEWRERMRGAGNGRAIHLHALRDEHSPTYGTWATMLSRCRNSHFHKYKDYGARGITVCDRWLTFENFLADMGERPKGRSIDRINNDGNYEPGNCRWATPQEQRQNQRPRAK